jgi:hypothetical protein
MANLQDSQVERIGYCKYECMIKIGRGVSSLVPFVDPLIALEAAYC